MANAQSHGAAHPLPEDASNAQLNRGATAGFVLSVIGLVIQGAVAVSFLLGMFAG